MPSRSVSAGAAPPARPPNPPTLAGSVMIAPVSAVTPATTRRSMASRRSDAPACASTVRYAAAAETTGTCGNGNGLGSTTTLPRSAVVTGTPSRTRLRLPSW
jgi:hypothetical protein